MCAQSEVMKLHFCFLLIVALDFMLRSMIHLHSFLYMIYNLVYGKIGSNLFLYVDTRVTLVENLNHCV